MGVESDRLDDVLRGELLNDSASKRASDLKEPTEKISTSKKNKSRINDFIINMCNISWPFTVRKEKETEKIPWTYPRLSRSWSISKQGFPWQQRHRQPFRTKRRCPICRWFSLWTISKGSEKVWKEKSLRTKGERRNTFFLPLAPEAGRLADWFEASLAILVKQIKNKPQLMFDMWWRKNDAHFI